MGTHTVAFGSAAPIHMLRSGALGSYAIVAVAPRGYAAASSAYNVGLRPWWGRPSRSRYSYETRIVRCPKRTVFTSLTTALVRIPRSASAAFVERRRSARHTIMTV